MTRVHINGKERDVMAPADAPLLWVLRDELALTGTKYGCGAGLCGACTVLIDGQAVRSCVTPVGKIAGKKIITIEGLSPAGSHPLQVAWSASQVSQCGFCQPGQIMSACALLAKNARPDDAAIDAAMAGNLCRCGTYSLIRQAIHAAAEASVK